MRAPTLVRADENRHYPPWEPIRRLARLTARLVEGTGMSKSLHIARWVLPVIVGLVLFMPLGCTSWSGLCPETAPDCTSEEVTKCHSVVGITTNAALALVGIPVVVLTATAARRLLEEWRARPSPGVPLS